MLLIAWRCCLAWCSVSFWFFVMLVLLALVVGKRPSSCFHCVGGRFCFIPSTLHDFVAVDVAAFANSLTVTTIGS